MIYLVNFMKKKCFKEDGLIGNYYGYYVGRSNSYYGLKGGILGNKFSEKKYGRDGCIDMFEKWITEEMGKLGEVYSEIIRLREISRKHHLVLVCWCAPKRCHSEVIKRIIEA